MTKNQLKTIKFFKNNWVALANLFVTILVGIIVATYLQKDQQKFQAELQSRDQFFQAGLQNKLIELEDEIKRKSQLANLKVSVKCSTESNCVSPIYIYNDGPTVAQNVKIVFYIGQFNYLWSNDITNIEQFTVKISDPSLNYSIEKQKLDTLVLSERMEGNNAIVITIESIPVGKVFFISMGIDDAASYKTASSKNELTVSIPKAIFSSFNDENIFILAQPIVENLTWLKYYSVRVFGKITCANCEGLNDVLDFKITTIRKTIFHYEKTFTKKIDGTEARINLEIEYYLPSDPRAADDLDFSKFSTLTYELVNSKSITYGLSPFLIEPIH